MNGPSFVPEPTFRAHTVRVAVDDEVLDTSNAKSEYAPPQRLDHGLDALGAGGVVAAEVLVLFDAPRRVTASIDL